MTSGSTVSMIVVVICLMTEVSAVRVGAFRTAGKDDAIFQEGLVFEVFARSKIDCAQRCSARDDCVHFTWVSGSPGRCRGHSYGVEQSSSIAVPAVKTYSLVGKQSKSATRTWLNETCTTDTECPAVHSVCFKGQCLCTPGYYYSINQHNCTASCTDQQLQPTFLRYTGNILKPYSTCFHTEMDPITLEQCLEKCLSHRECHFVDFGKGTCCSNNDGASTPDNGFDLYQRNCE